MQFTELEIPGVWVIEPDKFGDSRGYFMASYKAEEFEKHVGKVNFIQDNESKSSWGVLRGLHFQTGGFVQAKLVRVIVGSVLDVAVDLRPDSVTFGNHIAMELSAENSIQMFIPRGFAHGFIVLSETAIFGYKVDNVYAPNNEYCLLANDPALGIDWRIPEEDRLVSEKDRKGLLFKDLILSI